MATFQDPSNFKLMKPMRQELVHPCEEADSSDDGDSSRRLGGDDSPLLHADSPLSSAKPELTAGSPSKAATTRRRTLTTLSLVGVTYFAICGGPIGSEAIVSAGGPLLGFVGLIAFPLLLCFPLATITAELSTAFPSNGGYTLWVLHAFGPFWAFQTGYWSWLSGVVDTALYPALLLEIFTDAAGSKPSAVASYLIKATLTTCLAIPNLLGVKAVGDSMALLSVFVSIPFLVLALVGISRGYQWSALGEIRRSDPLTNANGTVIGMTGALKIDWPALLNVYFWNFSGTPVMSLLAGEVENPARSFPFASALCVILISMTYAIPLFGACVFNEPHWSTWEEGDFVAIAQAVGGSTLSKWILVAAVVSNGCMYVSCLFCDSFELLGMAESGLAPRWLFVRHQRFNTPHLCILCSVVIMLTLATFPFESILGVTNALTAFFTIATVLAFLHLRVTQPTLNRPFRVPGNLVFLVTMCLPAIILLLAITVLVLSNESTAVLVVLVVAGGMVYAHRQRFTDSHFEQLTASVGH